MALLLALVTIALYWPVTGHEFINFDDNVYVTNNAHVPGGLTLENARWAFTTLDVGLWHPLTWFSHMADCQWFGLRPGGHHLTSLLLHAANTMLLFMVLLRMTDALWRSALVAALFAVHPLHVESVAWVAERKDVLSTLFVMLTLWAYHRFATSRQQPAARGPSPGFRLPSSGFYLLSFLFFIAGLMSKPMVVTLPLVLLLLDYWPLKRRELSDLVSRPSLLARLIMEKLPFLLASLVSGLLTLHGGTRLGSLATAAQCPFPDRIANATLSYARYVLEVFWPVDLAVYYPFPTTFSAWSVTGAAVLLLAITVAACCLARRWPYVIVGWLWYLITLLPVIGLIQLAGYSHADRYTYVSLIGLFVSLVWGAADVVSLWRRPALAFAAAAVAAAIVLCLVMTRQQLDHWKDSEALFRHALAVTENNYLSQHNLGNALGGKGRLDEAIPPLQEAVRLKPDYAEAHNDLGTALGMKGRTDEAISQFQEAIRLKPDYATARNNLGTAFFHQGRMDEAVAQFQEALRLKPDFADARNNLKLALAAKAAASTQPSASPKP